jgi:hypothetical protein
MSLSPSFPIPRVPSTGCLCALFAPAARVARLYASRVVPKDIPPVAMGDSTEIIKSSYRCCTLCPCRESDVWAHLAQFPWVSAEAAVEFGAGSPRPTNVNSHMARPNLAEAAGSTMRPGCDRKHDDSHAMRGASCSPLKTLCQLRYTAIFPHLTLT